MRMPDNAIRPQVCNMDGTMCCAHSSHHINTPHVKWHAAAARVSSARARSNMCSEARICRDERGKLATKGKQRAAPGPGAPS